MYRLEPGGCGSARLRFTIPDSFKKQFDVDISHSLRVLLLKADTPGLAVDSFTIDIMRYATMAVRQ